MYMVVTTYPDATTLTNIYNGDSKRVRSVETTGDRRFVYSGNEIISEVPPANSNFIYYTHNLGSYIYYTNVHGFNQENGSGSTVTMRNKSGVVQNETEYDAYGKVYQIKATTYRPTGFGGQKGCYTVRSSGMVLCGVRYYLPTIGRWLTQDPAGQSAGLNLYEYCGSNPLNKFDPSGLDGDWDWGQYGSDMRGVFIGEGRSLNPINWATGLWSAGAYLHNRGGSLDSFKQVGLGMMDGISFWNNESPEAFGESFMSFTLTVSPLIAKVPNLTPFRLNSFALQEGGEILLRYDNMNMAPTEQRFRLDLHRLPNRNGIPANLRGKWCLQYHRRPGMKVHRPFERGW